jgi:hypothetical protein
MKGGEVCTSTNSEVTDVDHIVLILFINAKNMLVTEYTWAQCWHKIPSSHACCDFFARLRLVKQGSQHYCGDSGVIFLE